MAGHSVDNVFVPNFRRLVWDYQAVDQAVRGGAAACKEICALLVGTGNVIGDDITL